MAGTEKRGDAAARGVEWTVEARRLYRIGF
jgi:hypothetical protein